MSTYEIIDVIFSAMLFVIALLTFVILLVKIFLKKK